MSVFISYNWQAKAFAEATVSLLASAGISYWRDDEQVRAGESLFQRLGEGISECSVMLVFLTQEYVRSENCALEVQLAAGYHKPRLVLRLPDIACPPPVGTGKFAARIAFALAGTTYLVTDGVTPPAGELLPALLALGVAASTTPTKPPPSSSLLRTIPWEQLQPTGDVRGNGTYGTVRAYTWTARGDMQVAVKELSRAAASALTPADIAAFHREAQLQAHLEHDHVARVYALAECGGAAHRLGLVMKLYERPLSAVLGCAQLPPALRAAFVLQIDSGLAYMHGEGVVHGDLKPDNVLLAAGGNEVALTDFGCSTLKHIGCATSDTNKGAGTLAFMAPELFEKDANGAPVNGVSMAADVYAFGVTAWCLLADRVAPYPRDGANRPVFVAMRVPAGLRPGEGLASRGVPGEWLSLLQRCWAGSEAARPRMMDVVAQVKGLVGLGGVGGLGGVTRGLSPAGSTFGLAAAVGSIAAAALAGGGGALLDCSGAVDATGSFTLGSASVEAPTISKNPLEVVELMRAGGQSASLAERACGILRSCAFNTAGIEACIAAGAVPALVAALKGHPRVAAVVEKACSALCCIAVHPAGQEAIVAAGAVAAIVAGLRCHPSVAALVESACGALRGISTTVTGQEACVAAGAVPIVVAALISHARVEAAVEKACSVLCNLAALLAGQEAIVATDALPALVTALKCHSSAADVTESACAALHNIAANSSAGQRACVAAGAVPVLASAKRFHSGNARKNASDALAVLGYSF